MSSDSSGSLFLPVGTAENEYDDEEEEEENENYDDDEDEEDGVEGAIGVVAGSVPSKVKVISLNDFLQTTPTKSKTPSNRNASPQSMKKASTKRK